MLNLFDVFTSGGRKRTENIEYLSDRMQLANVSYDIFEKSPIRLDFENVGNGKISLKGDFECTLLIPCDRCLEMTKERIKCDFDILLVSAELTNVSDDEVSVTVDGNEFDVFEFVNQCVLMNMPSKVLCREDCKGLCIVCGHNLNESDCGCDSFVPDPRMAAIADIFYANKEV